MNRIRCIRIQVLLATPQIKINSIMISKVKYSTNLSSTIRYIMNPEKGAYIVLYKGIYSTTNLIMIIKYFETQYQLLPNLKTKGVHSVFLKEKLSKIRYFS